ncbi:MAG: fructosamine kinase family protein [Verrucomicrobia bacterium]|nr:fructosamine kinase family protein [Verrucomicrobiota bacterium]MCH8513620.1 fructosamine kinase family protein [Kiritimatiellia bacterium]
MNVLPEGAGRVAVAMGSQVVNCSPLGGGCVARAWKMTLADGRDVFVKTVSGASPFEAEALGLRHLQVADGIRVPEVYHVEPGLLILEAMTFGQPAPDWQEQFGRRLAITHQKTDDSFGFELDHVIGETPQANLPRVSCKPGAWREFWWTHRLEPMLRRLPAETARRYSRLESSIPRILPENDFRPGILHGDLWSGNAAADARGRPVMFDPAAYYGHPEADLSMTRVFGGFRPDFYQAYREVHPLEEGWSERLDFYMLYHVLNHLILFGHGYAPQAERLLQKFT